MSRPCMTDTWKRDGSVTATSVPSDLALRISSLPPCSCTSALAIGRPRPAPSRQREWLASTCAKGVSATAISVLRHADARIADADRGAAVGERTRRSRAPSRRAA